MPHGWRASYLRYREFYLNILALYRQRADLRAFTEIILSISTIAVFLVFALKPTALTIISLISEIREKESTISLLNQKIADLQTSQRVYAQNQNQITHIDVAVQSKPRPDLISKQVQAIAAKNSVAITDLSIEQINLIGTSTNTPKKTSDRKPFPDGVIEMPILINVRGDYPNLVLFIKDLENLRIQVKIDSLAVNLSENKNVRVITATISGRVPYLGNK